MKNGLLVIFLLTAFIILLSGCRKESEEITGQFFNKKVTDLGSGLPLKGIDQSAAESIKKLESIKKFTIKPTKLMSGQKRTFGFFGGKQVIRGCNLLDVEFEPNSLGWTHDTSEYYETYLDSTGDQYSYSTTGTEYCLSKGYGFCGYVSFYSPLLQQMHQVDCSTYLGNIVREQQPSNILYGVPNKPGEIPVELGSVLKDKIKFSVFINCCT